MTLVMVTSVDGKITHGDDSDVSSWSSVEDQEHFRHLIEDASVIVMGRKTYEVAKEGMEHRAGRLRVVMTRTPGKFEHEQKLGMLEFTHESPRELVQRLKKNVLVVGGSEVSTAFLRANLVTRLLLTIEPWVFGEGKSLFGDEVPGVALHLVKSQQLNSRGTLLLEYKVAYED